MTRKPTIQQMKSRMNGSHHLVLKDAATGYVSSGLSREQIKAYGTAKRTLFAWGCLENGPMQRDEHMHTFYPLIITDRGKALTQ